MSRPTFENICRASILALDEYLQHHGVNSTTETGFLRVLEILNYIPKPYSRNEMYVKKVFQYVLDQCSDDETWKKFKSRVPSFEIIDSKIENMLKFYRYSDE
jgi:hypothetical protein